MFRELGVWEFSLALSLLLAEQQYLCIICIYEKEKESQSCDDIFFAAPAPLGEWRVFFFFFRFTRSYACFVVKNARALFLARNFAFKVI